jgi:hypothetical protein
VHPSFAASTVPLTLRRPSRWPREPARIPYAAAAPFGGMAGHGAVMEEVESQERRPSVCSSTSSSLPASLTQNVGPPLGCPPSAWLISPTRRTPS